MPSSIVGNHMEKNMTNELETGILFRFRGVRYELLPMFGLLRDRGG